MRLKPSLKTLARPALLFSLSCLLTIISGCDNAIQATYKEKDIPAIIKNICKEEYGLEVTTTRTDSTIWTYAPLDKILHEEYGKTEGKIFDEALIDKLRHMITTIGRVLISSDNTPDFYVLVVSDIKLGIDYTLIGNALDMKKSFADFIPWTEANRRYVIKLQLASDAIGDTTGAHVKTHNIQLPDFLADQIAQRMGNIFQEENLKDYFQVEKTEGRYEAGVFYFDYQIKEIKKPAQDIDITKRLIDVASYCIRSYDFRNFTTVNLTDLANQNKWNLNNAAIWQRPSVL